MAQSRHGGSDRLGATLTSLAAVDPTLADRLRALEERQRSEEVAPDAQVEREAGRIRLPEGGKLPRSAAFLERLYAGHLVPREEKELVVDTRRSSGPFMASIDDVPLVVLDACGQVACSTHGFANRGILRALHEGRFAGSLWSNPDTTVADVPELAAFTDALRGVGPPGLRHVCFVAAGGAEANEKALRIARLQFGDGPSRRRVLAFRQGFHGRTLATSMATWSPDKRGSFEVVGHEAVFVDPDLADVERAIREHESDLYAVLVEPMMAERGDVHRTREFLLGLRRLTRAHSLPFIVDEVQTGFRTSGEFLWLHHLGLALDEDSAPDLVTLAEKVQLGVVLSRWPDPEPAPIHVASALRGLIHLEGHRAQRRLQPNLLKCVQELAAAHPEIENPRVIGTTCAFELPSAGDAATFIAHGVHHGFMAYSAGERTIRFRLNASFRKRHLELLFARIDRALLRLHDPTAGRWIVEGHRRRVIPTFEIRGVRNGDWAEIESIEQACYESARQTPLALLETCAEQGVGLVACEPDDGGILGFCFAAPVELFPDVDGPRQDDSRGRHESLYSVDLTVTPRARDRGVGRALKRAQLTWARRNGYRFVTGRNKVGATDSMMAVNRSFGSYPIARYRRQYDGSGSTEYYRIPLGPPPAPKPAFDTSLLDLASGIQRPFGPAPAFMARRELVGPTASKINLSNFATLDSVHYLEHLRLVLPRGTAHAYVTSSRDETVDKAIRCLRSRRREARIAVGLAGGYVGHTTAAARSISDPVGFGPGFALFDWPRLPHPAQAGIEATIAALEGLIAVHGATSLFGLFFEIAGERSGLVVDAAAASELAAACRRHDVPLVVVETATGCYRSGAGAWGLEGLSADVVPDMVLWYPGGQLGHVFVGERYFVDQPLMLVSTWDGDELSMIRTHEHLRAAWRLDLGPAIAALGEIADAISAVGSGEVGGIGLYRTITFSDRARAQRIADAAARRGVRLGRGAPSTVILAPALDHDPVKLQSNGLAAIRAILTELRR